jgi:hypothetical protein
MSAFPLLQQYCYEGRFAHPGNGWMKLIGTGDHCMSIGTRDIEHAQRIAEAKMGYIGLTQEDVRRLTELLTEYGRRRGALLDGMLALLGRSDDVESLDRDWKDCCSQGKDLLSRLNDEVPPRDGEGLAGIGLDSFYRGELKTWNENANAEIAFAVKKMRMTNFAVEMLMDKCRREIADIADNDKVIKEAVRGIFPNIITTLKDLLVNTGKLEEIRHSRDLGKYSFAGPYLDPIKNELIRAFNNGLEMARKRGALRHRLYEQINLLRTYQDQLGYNQIDQAFDQGMRCAESLRNCRDGDFEAEDWKEFAEQCRGPLEVRREKAKNASHDLFEGLYPAITEDIARSYNSLYPEGGQFDAWNEEIQRVFQNMTGALQNQEQLNSALQPGPFLDAARTALAQFRAMVGATLEQYGLITRDIQAQMNQQ